MKLTVLVADTTTEHWQPLTEIQYPAISNSWLAEGRMPTEEETLPKRKLVLPSGEHLEIGLVRSAETNTTNVFAFAGGKNLLLVGEPLVIFTSPGGSIVHLEAKEA